MIFITERLLLTRGESSTSSQGLKSGSNATLVEMRTEIDTEYRFHAKTLRMASQENLSYIACQTRLNLALS